MERMFYYFCRAACTKEELGIPKYLIKKSIIYSRIISSMAKYDPEDSIDVDALLDLIDVKYL